MVQIFEFEPLIKGNLEVIVTNEKSEDACSLIFGGSLDTSPYMEIKEKIDTYCFDRKYNYIVDMEYLNYIGSRGIGLIMRLIKNQKESVFLSTLQEGVENSIRMTESVFELPLQFQPKTYKSLNDLKGKVSSKFINVLERKKQKIKKDAKALENIGKNYWVKIIDDFVDTDKLKAIHEVGKYLGGIKKDHKIIVPAEEMYAAAIYRLIEHAFKRSKINIAKEKIEFVAKEVVNNSCFHGYQGKKGGKILAFYNKNKSDISFNFIDAGIGMKRSVRGRGMAMIRETFDKINYGNAPEEFINKQKEEGNLVLGSGTKVELVKRIKE